MKNAENNMIIRNTDNDLKDAFLAKANKLGLTISNDNETKNGIENIEIGHCISVGTSDKFHINWAKRIDYYAGRGIVPVYDISLDWKAIVARLESYANAIEADVEDDNEFELNDGTEVTVDTDEQEVSLDGKAVLEKADLKTLRDLVNMGASRISVDNDDETIDIDGDFTITFDELTKLEEALEG